MEISVSYAALTYTTACQCGMKTVSLEWKRKKRGSGFDHSSLKRQSLLSAGEKNMFFDSKVCIQECFGFLGVFLMAKITF